MFFKWTGVLRKPVFDEIVTTDIDTYKKYKEENKNYDNVEIEIFYINAFFMGDKSNLLRKMFDKYHNIYYFNRMDNHIPMIFSYYNRNVPPFITSNISFSDKDKKQLVEDIKQYLIEKL